ncbi:MAG: tetratricopeptide repeat protein, partial [Nitrospirae bacterium]
DYILFWLSKAYQELGNSDEANYKIKELLKGYPDSPLRKKARSKEIKNIIASNEIPLGFESQRPDLKLFEAYIKDYPEDYETKFLFGQVLKSKEKKDKAKTIFKDIYVNSQGTVSKTAYNELTPSDITVSDLIEKASNLINIMEFKEAESILRAALLKLGSDSQRDDDRRKTEILKKLGHALFKQKKYKESADIYEKAGDNYWGALALYRAGEKTAFAQALKKTASAGDKKTGLLLLLAASDKRRNNEIDEALSIYKTIKANYPSEAEDSLWGAGWTYYRSGDYPKALDAFTELCKVYGSSKYLYWKTQTMEKSGRVGSDSQRDAAPIYKQLAEKERDFYSVLARIKNNQVPGFGFQGLEVSANPQTPIPKPYSSERIDILLELGMKKEAVSELTAIARKTVNTGELLSIAVRLQDAGEYRMAILLASKLPYKEAAHNILYPPAHWAAVTELSADCGVDPFIVLSIMREESRFDPEARSQAGALGLMQLMPQTAGVMNRDIKSREQLCDIKTNISLGARYIGSLMKEFNSLPLALAAYNAGEDTVKKWQKAGSYKSVDEFIEDIPYDETKNYVKRVLTTYFEYLRHSDRKEMPKIL